MSEYIVAGYLYIIRSTAVGGFAIMVPAWGRVEELTGTGRLYYSPLGLAMELLRALWSVV